MIMGEKKETILMVHNYYQIPGGEDTVVANEKKLLEEHGHKVILYTRSNSELKTMGVLKKIFLPFSTIFNVKTYCDIKMIIKKNGIDIVHVHNTLNLVSPSVYYAAINCGVPVVQTLHNFRMMCPAATFYRDGHICEECLNKGLKCAIKYSCYRNSKIQTLACVINTLIHRKTGIYKKINFICLTEFNKGKLLWLNKTKKVIDETKIYIKPNFTFEVDLKPDYNMSDVAGGGGGDYYMFIGRLEKIKGISVVIQAFSKLKETKLKIAGTGRLEDFCEGGLSDNIECLGYLDREHLVGYLKDSKALVAASQVYEAFGMNVIEAFACGTSVIVGDIGNIGALVDDRVTGLKYVYDDSDCLADKIVTYEKMDLNEINRMRFNARLEFEEKYSPESNYEIFKYIYHSVRNA